MTLADLQRLSVSQSELVLPYPHAITALQLLEATGAMRAVSIFCLCFYLVSDLTVFSACTVECRSFCNQ